MIRDLKSDAALMIDRAYDDCTLLLNRPKRRRLETFVADTSDAMMSHGSRAVQLTRWMAARTTHTILAGISGDLSKRKEK